MAEQLHPLRQLLGLLGMRPANARNESAGVSASADGQFSKLLESLLPGGDVQETTAVVSSLGVDVAAEAGAVQVAKTDSDDLTDLPATDEPGGEDGTTNPGATTNLAALLNLASSLQTGPAPGQGTGAAPSPLAAVPSPDAPAPLEASLLPQISMSDGARVPGGELLPPPVSSYDMGRVLETAQQEPPEASTNARAPERTAEPAPHGGPVAQQRPAVEQQGAIPAPDRSSMPEQREMPHVPRAAAGRGPEIPPPGTEALDRKPAGETPIAAEQRTAPQRAHSMIRKVSTVTSEAVDALRGLTHMPANEGEQKPPSKANTEPVREGGQSVPAAAIGRNVLQGRAYTVSFGNSSPAAGEMKNPLPEPPHGVASADQPAPDETAPADQALRPAIATAAPPSSGQAAGEGPGARGTPIVDAHATKGPVPDRVFSAQGNDASALPPGLTRGVVDQVVKSLSLQLEKGSSEMRITLQPASLGEVKLHVRMEEGKMQAQIDVTQIAVKNVLEANLPQLRQELAARGIEMHRFDVFTSDQAFPREAPGGQGDRSRRQGGRRAAESSVVEQYQGSRSMGYNTMELIM